MNIEKAVDAVLTERAGPGRAASKIITEGPALTVAAAAVGGVAVYKGIKAFQRGLEGIADYIENRAEKFHAKAFGKEGDPAYERLASKYMKEAEKILAQAQGALRRDTKEDPAPFKAEVARLRSTVNHLHTELNDQVKDLKKKLPRDANMGARLEHVRNTIAGAKSEVGHIKLS